MDADGKVHFEILLTQEQSLALERLRALCGDVNVKDTIVRALRLYGITVRDGLCEIETPEIMPQD